MPDTFKTLEALDTVAVNPAPALEAAAAPIVPVVLSGGSGTRLWPVSRAMYPKQFVKFLSDQKKSFLSSALGRLPRADGFRAPIILCNNDHRFLVEQELVEAGIAADAIILEPCARNTAPAITAAAIFAEQTNPGAILVVMPSDHIIADEPAFKSAILRAAAVAMTGRLVLLGIEPAGPHTGYGYIRMGAPIGSLDEAFFVDGFMEKPAKSVAEGYLADGGYVWNSGIFVLPAAAYLKEVRRLAPSVFAAANQAVAKMTKDLGFLRLDALAFEKAPEISIDYAVMEKTKLAAVIPLNVGWNDVGSWASIWDTAEHDEHGNHCEGNAILTDTTNSFIHSQSSLVATIGVQDLIIVDTPDALLIADKSRAQDVSGIVKHLKASGRSEWRQHIRNTRPWGYFETLSLGSRFQVKKLHVKPGGKLSLQMHHHRSEHWIVVQGTAKVTVGEIETLLRENESVYIFATQWHRLENPGKVPLELIEVQIGTYLGEDDIVRTDDIYRRAAEETK
jgi:mannose-1-phosphate guanylyltransferase / mannose-6-phosphate isomerase